MLTKQQEKHQIQNWLKKINAKTFLMKDYDTILELRDADNRTVAEFKYEKGSLTKLKHGKKVPPICIYYNLHVIKKYLTPLKNKRTNANNGK